MIPNVTTMSLSQLWVGLGTAAVALQNHQQSVQGGRSEWPQRVDGALPRGRVLVVQKSGQRLDRPSGLDAPQNIGRIDAQVRVRRIEQLDQRRGRLEPELLGAAQALLLT